MSEAIADPAPITEPIAAPDDGAQALDMAMRLLRQCEGCRLSPYTDSAGVWTIGIGTIRLRGEPVGPQTPSITLAEAEAAMEDELRPTAAAVDSMLAVFCTVGQRAALYSFAYNLGTHALRTSTLLARLNAGDAAAAAEQFPAWIYAGGRPVRGLQTRRALERAVFEGTITP